MSGIKQEVQWSPVQHNEFITWGAEIYLYKTVPTEKVSGPHFILSHSTSAQLLATNSAHHYLKCVDIYRKYEKDTLLAVGQANGKVCLSTFGSTVFDTKGISGLEFVPKHTRQCNSLMWNGIEHGLLAAGLEKYRSDHGVLVWNVELSDSHTPVAELGLSDTANSLCWLPSSTQSLAIGFNNKSIRIIDIKDSSKTVNSCQTKAVYGVSICPDNHHQLASYFEHQLAIWDLRNFEKPLITVQKIKPISKISWCPTRKNLLGCLLKESSSIHIVDVQSQSDDREEASIIERNVKPGLSHTISSFSWHPSNHNRLLALSFQGAFIDYSVSERMTLSWGNTSTITWTSDSKTLKMIGQQDEFFEAIGDISLTIKKRVINNYGLIPSLKENADLVDKEDVKNLWRWLEQSQELVDDGTIESPNTRHPGIRCVLGIDVQSSVLLGSEAQFLSWSTLSSPSSAKVYRSEVRDKGLMLCGWKFVFDSTLLHQTVEDLINKGELTRAASYCVFGLNLKAAIQILSSDPKYSTVAMALAGFTNDKSSIWKESCTVSRSHLNDPYLRMIFSFLTCDVETFDSVFTEVDVEVADRVGFALTFLSDSHLTDYIEQLTESLICQGNLSGILLTGMSLEGIALLQNYINISSDIQTASLVSMRTLPKELLDNERVAYWISSYRELLNMMTMWEKRAEFDIWLCGRQGSRPQHQVFVTCNFCGKSTSPAFSPAGARNKSHYQRYSASSNQAKVSCCPHCRKPQPRCAICLVHMGTGSCHQPEPNAPAPLVGLQNPFSFWYTWCQTCRHGGHVSHITSWFREHSECPVTACSCKCMSLDPLGAAAALT